MTKAYVVIAVLVVAVVVLQLALEVVVFVNRAMEGTVAIDRAMPDDGAGLAHQMLGLYVMPVLATGLLICSFDTRYAGATRWALGVCGLFLLNVTLISFGVLYGTGFAALHVLVALALAVVSLHAALRLRTAAPDEKWDLDDYR